MLGIALVGLAPGCAAHDCAAVDWYEGLTVTVQGLDPSSDETHEFRIDGDGTEVVAAIEFEDGVGNCIPDTAAGTQCSANAYAGNQRWLNASLEWIRPAGAILNLHYVDLRERAGGPEVARIQVLRAGETVADRTFEPDYESDEPNGEGCGVVTSAEAELTLAPAHVEN